jgi:hypothetical protein
VYEFPALPQNTFHGLPGLLADSLPDKFGNALINAWLATQGRTPESFNAVERLFEEVQSSVRRWPDFAAEAGLTHEWRDTIQKTHRLSFGKH